MPMKTRTTLTILPKFRCGKKTGYSLTELMLAIVILSVVALIMISLFSHFVTFFLSDDDRVLARQRGMDAISLLEIPVLHTALGIPSNISGNANRSDIFQKTFTDPGAAPKKNPPFLAWGAPISISGAKKDNLRILYAVESGVFQVDENGDAFFDTPLTANLKLNEPLDASEITEDSPANTRSWITFAGPSLPIYIESGVNTLTPTGKSFRLSIQGGDYNEKIRAFSEVLYIKAIRAWVDSNDVFHVMEVLSSENPGSGPEQTIPGVLRVQFETDSRTLSMDLLTRGDSRDPARVSRLKTSRPDLVSRWSLTDAETEYVLDEISVQWRIRNYEYK